jgi:hypothetical protein
MEIIRCPYCVETEGGRPMTVQSKGDWLICDICGHLALPSKPLFECTCSKCVALRGDAQDQTPGRNDSNPATGF